MLWLSRPPYLRWFGAALVVTAAFALETRPEATIELPFARADLATGVRVEAEMVEWRKVPDIGVSAPDLSSAMTTTDIAQGDLLTSALVTSDSGIPPGWWSVPIALPAAATTGTAVRLVLDLPRIAVDGVVVATGDDEAFSISDAGLVAVPPESADDVARAAAAGALTLLIAP